MTGIEVFESAGTLVVQVQVLSRHPGNLKSWVRISREFASSQQSVSDLRATTGTGDR